MTLSFLLGQTDKNLNIHQIFTETLSDMGKNEALSTLKELRDKMIAHPEDIAIEPLNKKKWGEVEKLIKYPKDFVGVIGDGYLGMSYIVDSGECLPTTDATHVGRGTARLLKHAGIMPSSNLLNRTRNKSRTC